MQLKRKRTEYHDLFSRPTTSRGARYVLVYTNVVFYQENCLTKDPLLKKYFIASACVHNTYTQVKISLWQPRQSQVSCH